MKVFEIFLHMKMSEDKEITSDFKMKKMLLNVDGVKVKETSQGDGIAMMTYKSIIKNQGIVLNLNSQNFFYNRYIRSC
jgi:hypothetical protein